MHQELPPLQTRIDEMTILPLQKAVPALLDLARNLTTTLSPVGQRLVTHPNCTGMADLNDLGRFYIRCASRCTDEHAPFQTRLDHQSLDPIFNNLYKETDEAIMNALDSGALDKPYREFQGGCCAHCSGEPAAVIPAGFVEGNALYFEEAEYKQLWGDVRPIGMTCSWEPERTTCMATREQVEEAMKRFSSQPARL